MGLIKRPESNVWYIVFEHAGRRYRASSGTTNKTKALASEARMRAELLAGNDPGTRPRSPLHRRGHSTEGQSEGAVRRQLSPGSCAAGSRRTGKGVSLTAYRSDRNPHGSWATAVGRAGLGDLHLHDLRHTFASRLVMRCVPILAVSKLMGHASLTMTMRYAHLAPDGLDAAIAQADMMEQPRR